MIGVELNLYPHTHYHIKWVGIFTCNTMKVVMILIFSFKRVKVSPPRTYAMNLPSTQFAWKRKVKPWQVKTKLVSECSDNVKIIDKGDRGYLLIRRFYEKRANLIINIEICDINKPSYQERKPSTILKSAKQQNNNTWIHSWSIKDMFSISLCLVKEYLDVNQTLLRNSSLWGSRKNKRNRSHKP